MEPITIRWEAGYMTINPDAFFPTSTARIRKLLRVVALDFEHQDVIRMQLAGACESRAQEILDGRKSLANEAVNHHQKAADLEPQIERSGAFRKKKREFEATAEKLRQNAEVLRP